MIDIAFKEILENFSNRISECPLGEQAKKRVLDHNVTKYDKPLAIVNDNIKGCPIDGNNGHWDGERGNSNWYPEQTSVPGKHNPEGNTWQMIFDKYRVDHIEFKEGEPNFSPFSEGTVKIEGFSANRSDNYDKADIELAKEKRISPDDIQKWRKENKLTWHECKDMKTAELVPSEVHGNIRHSGGISEVKKGMVES